jgi:TM2 domain-containing membrane protein YozV
MSKKRKVQGNPVVSVILALVFGGIGILGIGHIYNGEWKRGLTFMLGYWIFWFFGYIFLVLTNYMGILFLLPVALSVYAWSAFDAYHRALGLHRHVEIG